MKKKPVTEKASYVEEVHKGAKMNLEAIRQAQQMENPEESEEYRSPLSIDKTIEVKILLSWGGPEDGFKLTFSEEKELLYGVYYRATWGEYKETPLLEEEAQMVFDFYMGGEVI